MSSCGVGQLPTLHSTQQPIKLQQTEQPMWHQTGRPRQEVVIGPDFVPHEGRILRLVDDVYQPPAATHHPDKAAHQSVELLNDLDGAGLASAQSGLFTGSDLKEHEDISLAGDVWSRSQFTQTADLEPHNDALAQASTSQASDLTAAAASDHIMEPINEFAVDGLNHASHAATIDSSAAASDYTMEAGNDAPIIEVIDVINTQDPQHMDESESIGYTEGKDILGLVGLTTEPTKEHHHPNATAHSSHTGGHMHMGTHLHGDQGTLHPGNPPASPTCFIHKDLPIPGMDIAPADKDRCYAHPLEYTNKVCIDAVLSSGACEACIRANYTAYCHGGTFASSHCASYLRVSVCLFTHRMSVRQTSCLSVQMCGGSVNIMFMSCIHRESGIYLFGAVLAGNCC